MVRLAREYNDTGVYHIIVRGNNRENIFSNKFDKEKYIYLIKESREKYNFEIYAFAIMDNHAHILIKIENFNLSKAMKYVQENYATFYNNKYQRSGRVFEDRFYSKGCKDDIYLAELIKYIHNNPQNAGLDEVYRNLYTSYQYYFNNSDSFVNTKFILSMFSEDINIARKLYLEFLGMEYKCTKKDIYLD